MPIWIIVSYFTTHGDTLLYAVTEEEAERLSEDPNFNIHTSYGEHDTEQLALDAIGGSQGATPPKSHTK